MLFVFRRASIILIVLIINSVCLSCDKEPTQAPLPPDVLNIYEEKEIEKLNAVVKANLFFDNTPSMYGFITRGEVSNFVVTIDSILDIIEGYRDYSLYALRPDEENTLFWQDLVPTGSFSYRNRDFYTFIGTFEKWEEGIGPLQLLFDDNRSIVNFDEINIFTSDLAEQNMRNIVLARKLNEVILEREDYAILIYCIESNFSGLAVVPLHGVVSTTAERLAMAVDNNFTGIRPFYLIVTGPTLEIFKLNDDISNSLSSAGLEESEDYYSSLILPQRGIQRSDINDLITIDMFEDTQLFKGVTIDVSNINYNFKTATYEELFYGITRDLPGLNFIFTSEYTPDRKEKNHGFINTILPLADLVDGKLADRAIYRIDKESIKVLGGRHVKVKDESEYETDDYLSVDIETGFTWKELDSYEYNRYLTIDMNYLTRGSEIFELSLVTTELENQGFDNELLYIVENESGALNIKLYFYEVDKIEHEYMSIILPILGKVEKNDYMPDWIDAFNLSTRRSFNPNNPSATPEYFAKTDGLLEFYNLLLGNYSSAVESEYFEGQMEKQIVELVVNIKFN